MTCEECWDVGYRLEEATTSERVAMAKHYLGCAACQKKMDELSTAVEGELSPEGKAEAHRAVDAAIAKDAKAIFTDPELR